MTADVLLGEFDRICEAPDAIPRLRRFILDLAVRGKLVPQDRGDEPASELLKRIQKEKARLGGDELISDASGEIAFQADEGLHSLPKTWQWTKIGEIFQYDIGRKRDPTELAPNLWLLELEDIEKDTSRLLNRVTVTERESRSTKSEFIQGDILYGKLRPYLNKVIVADQHGYSTTEIVAIRPYIPLCSAFCCLAFRRPDFVDYVSKLGQGTKMPRLRTQDALAAPFPLPPLAEQRRIVAKVDELMALCDQLEAARNAREENRDKLVAASLHRLGQPAGDALADRDHAPFTLDHLAPLTTRPEHIKQLRQAILNLAVRGKLVAQDPKDEPASELLRQILAHKTEVIGGKNGDTHTHYEPTRRGEMLVALPSGWTWSTFGAVMISRDSERVPISKDERSLRAKLYDYYGASGVIDKIDGYLFDEALLLIGEDGANLINRTSPIAFIARGKYWVNNHAHVLGAMSEDLLRYIELHINAIDLKPYVTGTAQPKMNQAKMNSIPIALPPLAEQRRIVAKVDELMALCDQLEAQLVTTESESRRLLEAALHEALG